MSWTKKTYQPKKFRPRQRTKDEVEYQRKIERAREEAKQHALKLENERKAKQIELEKQAKLRRELAEIQRKQNLIKQQEDDARKYFQQKDILWQHRLHLRTLNLEKNKTKPNKTKNKNLETKIKKIQGFLKKTKQFEKHSKNIQSLIREMKKLKLGPYIDEVVKDLTTTNISEKDEIDKLLHLVSALHYRFDISNNRVFLKPFRDAILDVFRPVSKAKLNKKKQIIHLSILIEMQYLGLIKHNSNTICELLKHIIKTQQKHKEKLMENIKICSSVAGDNNVDDNNYKIEDNKNKNEIMKMIFEYDEMMIHTLNLIIKFLKYTNEECLGEICVQDEKYYRVLDRDLKVSEHHIFSSKQKKQIKDLIFNYYQKISDKYVQLDLKLKKQRRMNNIILIERGSISDNRQDITDKLEDVVSKMKGNLRLFVEYLPNKLQFPKELAMDEDKITLNIDGQLTSLSDAQNASFFDDAVSQSFYENLPELKDNIPGSLLQGDNIVNKAVEKAPQEDADIDGVNITDMPTYLVDIAEDEYEEDNVSVEEDKKQYSMKDLLSALQCMGSRKETEFLAEKFCYLNSKNNRKYLASFLSSIASRQNTRLPFYCRFIAILNLSQINIGNRVCLSVEKEFYRLFLSKKSYLIDAKMANLSYIAELSKFSIFPFNSVFSILEKLSKKFNNESIELLSFFMFQCGRFLYKNPLTHIRLNKVLKYLKQRQVQTNLDIFLTQHINNAIFACKPPEKSACLQFENTLNDLQKYMEHLLYFELNHYNKQQILKKLRKLPWKEYNEFIISKLFNISVVNFDKIDCIAAIIAGLNCYHSLSTSIVDSVCEEIRIGLEEEDFTQEQRRLSYVKFLGELYTYKAVNSQVIFDTLYLFITYECNNDTVDDIDEDMCNFRISLCCMLLEVCGKYLRKGKLKSRCDRFLLYFQRFILNRGGVIPFDIEWWVNDVFKFIAPNMERYFSLEKILDKINKLERNHKDALLVLDEDEYDEYEEEEEFEYEEEEVEEQEFESSSEDDTADVNSYHRKKKITKEDKQFMDEYDAMMEQYRSGNAKKTNISNLKHASVLVCDLELGGSGGVGGVGKGNKSSNDSMGSDEEDEYGEVAFKLLSKKGVNSNKLKIGVIKIPKQVVVSMKLKQKKEIESADKIKAVTLQHLQNYEENEEEYEEEYGGYDDGVYDDGGVTGVVSGKSKFKQHSVSEKRKYKQNLKQMQHQQIEDEREKQKIQRDEKRKKQVKLAAVIQDFE